MSDVLMILWSIVGLLVVWFAVMLARIQMMYRVSMNFIGDDDRFEKYYRLLPSFNERVDNYRLWHLWTTNQWLNYVKEKHDSTT